MYARQGSHTYVLGATGSGKSTTIETLIQGQTNDREGMALVDPHGDLSIRVQELPGTAGADNMMAPDNRSEIGYNPLHPVSPAYRPLLASGVLEVFKKAWPDAWGARMEHILRNALLALLDQPSATLEDILRLLRDNEFRKLVASRVEHEPVRRFWQKEFHGTKDAIAPIENKVGAFLSDPLVYRIVCKPKKQLSFRRIMDNGETLLINLAKGRIGSDSSSILGGLFVTMIGLAAFSRADTPEEKRRPFTLYIDEFQNYTTLMVADMLSELRKYRVSMVMAHQYLDQLDPRVRDAVLGNVGTIVCFRLGPKDAATMESYFALRYRAQDLMLLRDHEVIIHQVVKGCPQWPPIKAVTLTPEQAMAAQRRRFMEGVAERKRDARRRERLRAEGERKSRFRSILFGQHDRHHP